MIKYINLIRIERVTIDGELEGIGFESGLNLMEGEGNAGKTVWLQMIDYLFGDRGAWKEAFADSDVADKYIEISGFFIINDNEIKITRKPQELGMATKILINDIIYGVNDFSSELYKLLNYPDDVEFPKGNPYTSSWVELSFRMIYRHIYRREIFWSDIADKQPPYEQMAAQYQLLGIAKDVYSRDYTESVTSTKELMALELQREQYNKVLDRIVQEMAPKNEEKILQYANENDVLIRISNLEADLLALDVERSKVIENGLNEYKKENQQALAVDTELAQQKADSFTQLESLTQDIERTTNRFYEFKSLSASLSEELEKLKRTKKAGIIADIKITNCPACDQAIKTSQSANKSHCFLCHQLLEKDNATNINRIDFEISQISSESIELKDITEQLQTTIAQLRNQERSVKERITYIDLQMAPLRKSVYAFTNSQISEIDVRRGRMQEQILNYKRLLNNIKYKEDLNKQLYVLENKIADAKEKQFNKSTLIDFATIADDWADGMQSYLNQITDSGKGWAHQGRVSIAINESRIAFYVDNKSWNTLGGLDRKYFLLAYHYGFLSLTGKKNYQYPGLVIIDLDAEFAEAQKGSHNVSLRRTTYWRVIGAC